MDCVDRKTVLRLSLIASILDNVVGNQPECGRVVVFGPTHHPTYTPTSGIRAYQEVFLVCAHKVFDEMSERKSEDRAKVHGYDIIRFNGRNNFKAWQMACKDILVSLEQFDSLDEKRKPGEKSSEDYTEKWRKTDQKACSTIHL